jgi:hypothetical protein
MHVGSDREPQHNSRGMDRTGVGTGHGVLRSIYAGYPLSPLSSGDRRTGRLRVDVIRPEFNDAMTHPEHLEHLAALGPAIRSHRSAPASGDDPRPDAAVGLATCVGGPTRSTGRAQADFRAQAVFRAQADFHAGTAEIPDCLERCRSRSCNHELARGWEANCKSRYQPRPMVRST